MKKALILLCLTLSIASPVVADQKYYDKEEEIRRTVERLAEYDQHQRQQAKQRADQEEYDRIKAAQRIREENAPPIPIWQRVVFLIVAFGVWVLFNGKSN